MDKKGDYKWGIILSLILGLMVLSLSLYFIFNELWSGDDIDRQICRQSIQLRATLPDFEVISFKDDYPLKCTTHIVEINKKNINDAEKIIAETMAECWALYGKGDENAFPAEVFKSSSCVPCARIHLTDEAKAAVDGGKISIRQALDLKMDPKYSYYVYLRDSGKKFSAFDFGNNVSFDLNGDGFEIKPTVWTLRGANLRLWESVELRNKINGGTYNAKMSSVDVSLPEYFDVGKGDLLINYGIVTISDNDFGDYVPYLFYFQTEDGNPFTEVKKNFVFNIPAALWDRVSDFFTLDTFTKLPSTNFQEMKNTSVSFCEAWEGIPA